MAAGFLTALFVFLMIPAYGWLQKSYPKVNWGYVVFGAISLLIFVAVATPVANMR